MSEKAGFTPAFLFPLRTGGEGDPAVRTVLQLFVLAWNLHVVIGIEALPVDGKTNMRVVVLGLILSAVSLPCLAQTVLKSEPFILAPYEIAFVQDATCGPGKVLKVTGAIRGLHRRKACVAVGAEQASLAAATP